MQTSEVTNWIDPVDGLDSPEGRFWYNAQKPYAAEFGVNAVTYQNIDSAYRYSTWATTKQHYLIKLKYRNITNEAYREIQNCVLLANGSMRSFYLDVELFQQQGHGFTNFTDDVEFECNETYSVTKTSHSDIVISSVSETGTLKKGDILLATDLFGYSIINFVNQETAIEFAETEYLVPISRSFRALTTGPYTVKLAKYIPVSLVENSFQADRGVTNYWNCEVSFVVRDTSL